MKKRLKYLTPLIIHGLVYLGLAVYLAILLRMSDFPIGLEGLLPIAGLIIFLASVIISIILNKLIKNRSLFYTIEIVIIIIVSIKFYYPEKSGKYIVGENNAGYVIVVYNVDKEKPLNMKFLDNGYFIEVPDDKIILTKSSKSEDLYRKKFYHKKNDKIDVEVSSMTYKQVYVKNRLYDVVFITYNNHSTRFDDVKNDIEFKLKKL